MQTSGSSVAIQGVLSRSKSVSIIDLVDSLVEQAALQRASDIHIDCTKPGLRVRFRIDGVLHEIATLPASVRSEVVSRIKVLAHLRTDEHQAAQDGRFRHTLQGDGTLDLRVSIVPTYHGESVVLRLLSDRAADFTLEELGFSKKDTVKILAAIKRPSGMILSTGPTGSGKTTTLYTLIKLLNKPERKIITIEDPIEYAIDNIEQIQVNPRAGLNFGGGLRAVLRRDPNIIMVGEIRDSETATVAVNTALTGHLLLSTLHTSDAATTLPRLFDLHVDPYLVATTINLAIGQRLVRKICTACKVELKVTPELVESLELLHLAQPFMAGEQLFAGQGCAACSGSGYTGRICVSEVLVATVAICEAILRKAPASELTRIAVAEGMTTLLEDGMNKVRAGHTTIDEILRVVHNS